MKNAASIAAQWWADQLKSHDRDKYNKTLSEDDPMFIMNYIMQDNCSQRQLDAFYVHLKNGILKQLEANHEIHLYSRFYPCELLEKIGNLVNILGISFPIGVDMIITPNVVKLKRDGDADYTTIFPK